MQPIRTNDPEGTREAILDAAKRLFVERGFAGTSMSEVAKLSGVTKSLIHHHFGSKEKLWGEVKARSFDEYAALQKGMLLTRKGGDLSLLTDSIKAYFDFLKADPQLVRMMSLMFLDGDENCPLAQDELIELGTQRLREAQSEGALRADVDPAHVIFIFLACALHWFETKKVFATSVTHKDLDAPAADDEFLGDFIKIFFDGVRPR
ncbi:MAG: TetR/AcrR family transcriptional regulator [Deltaproteobacteria bacterium]|nr:TetR/AcrR family transcriptional regulator [bacterium]MCB9487841.1 TetR/AcrR family transcriptional regulator [Deltaproteobacteria bacterium]